MKVPFPANCDQTNSKPLNHTITTTTFPATTTTTSAAAIISPYEPKSVLDLRRSPSPVADQKPIFDILSACDPVDPLQLEADRVLISQHLLDWDSLMKEFDLHDDSKPVLQPTSYSDTRFSTPTLPEFPPAVTSFDSNQFLPADFGLISDTVAPLNHSPFDGFSGDLNGGGGIWNVEFDYVDELIQLAECLETTSSLQLGHVILARLNQRLKSPTGKPLQRAAFYFKEALQSLLSGPARPASSSDIVQTIKAQKTFSAISPIPMFASFTANQAVLEALNDSMNVHVIDFDIGFGCQWASLMKELADKAAAPPVLRISAIVSEDYAMESRLIKENLTQFARELNISFDINFLSIRTFEYLSFKAIKFMESAKVAVILSPAIFRRVGTGFLNDLRRVSPHVVVHVNAEGHMDFGTTSYRQGVIDGLEFYSTVLESLEAANYNGGGDWMRRIIETFVVFPKIVEGVAASGRRRTAWREAVAAAGLRQVGLSQFAEFQAECLLKKVQVRGFHVVKRQAEMLLCWHDRPIVATSSWRF